MAVHVGGRGPGHLARSAQRYLGALSAFDTIYDFAGVTANGLPTFYEDGAVYISLAATPNTTFTRATTAITTDADGTLREVASGEPAIGRGRGMGFWPAIQNKYTGRNATPTSAADIGSVVNNAVVTAVALADLPAPVRAAFDARLASLGKITHVGRIQGNVGDAVNLGGDPGNTNPHTLSVYAFIVSGAANLLTSANESAVALQSGFLRTVNTYTPTLPTRNGRIRIVGADPADIYFALYNITETAYAAPPIITNGAAATRNADVHQKTGLALNPAGFAIYDEGTFEARLQNSYAYEISDGTGNNRFLSQSTNTDVLRAVVIVGGVQQLRTGPTLPSSAKCKNILRYNGDGSWSWFVNGVQYVDLTSALPPLVNQLNLGQRRDGQDFRKGAQAVFAIRNNPGLTDAECIAATTL